MSGPSGLVEKSVIELLLQHFDNETIGQLLNKAPLKQGLSILPVGASDLARNKAIQTLLINKNLKYVISAFESSQFSSFVQTDFKEYVERMSLEELKSKIVETDGLALEYLLYMLSQEKIDEVVQLFHSNTADVQLISELMNEGSLENFRFKRRQEPEKLIVDSNIDELEIQIKKLQNENQRLQKKLNREMAKAERDFENQIAKLTAEHDTVIGELEKNHNREISALKIKLGKSQREVTTQIEKNEKLERSINKLEEDLKAQLNSHRPAVLVVGNLPENSILDEQKYQISTIAKIDSNWDSLVSKNNELVKVYLQSEYVSTSEYLAVKKSTPNVSMEYLSREKMKKGI